MCGTLSAWRATLLHSADRQVRLDSLDAAVAPGAYVSSRLLWDATVLASAAVFEAASEPTRALAVIRRRNGFYHWPHYLAAQLNAQGRIALEVHDTAGALRSYRLSISRSLADRIRGLSPPCATSRQLWRSYRESAARKWVGEMTSIRPGSRLLAHAWRRILAVFCERPGRAKDHCAAREREGRATPTARETQHRNSRCGALATCSGGSSALAAR